MKVNIARDDVINIELFFSCTNLKDGDTIGKSDPRAVLQSRDSKGTWVEVGRTETIENDLNPAFKQSIIAEYFFETKQQMKVLVEDEDGTSDEIIGSREFELSSLLVSATSSVQLELQDKNQKPVGKVLIRCQKLLRERQLYEIDLKCSGVKDIEYFSKSDPYVKLSRALKAFPSSVKLETTAATDWVEIYRTEFKKDDLNPNYNSFKVTSNHLCRGDKNAPIKFEIWDHCHEGDHAHTLIGQGFITVNQIEGGMKTLATFDSKNKETGNIIFEKFTSEKVYDLMDYLNMGLTLNMIIGIDYTNSNGNPKEKTSLHFIDHNSKNSYESAIESVGNILASYDTDKKMCVYGFGGRMPTLGYEEVVHAFPLRSKDLHKPYASSVKDVLDLYEFSFSYVELLGPTCLQPLILEASKIAQQSKNAKGLSYNVLLIITDGAICDEKESIEALVDAASLPLSVIIIGVGFDDFQSMKKLDGDNSQLKDSQGRVVKRDLVQFVDLKEQADLRSLSDKVLKELPAQIVEYFKQAGIAPK